MILSTIWYSMEWFFFGNIFIEEWLGVLINPGIPVTGKSAGGGMVFPLGTGISTGVP